MRDYDRKTLSDMMGVDWTADAVSGEPGTSAIFREIVTVVEQVIREGAHSLINEGPVPLAERIVSHLARTYRFSPSPLEVTTAEREKDTVIGTFVWIGRAYHFTATPSK